MSKTLIDYFYHQLKFTQQYGNKCVVLVQYGNFFDCFQYIVNHVLSDEYKIDKNNKTWDIDIGVACDIYEMIDCDLTQKNNNKPYGIKNPYMVGFHCGRFNKNC